MRSQNNESDEEYLDDPIKLFDSELERVHFGSQSQGNTISDNFYEPSEHIESDNDLSEEFLSDSDYSQERDCLPSYIKLVDCAKFPWYYKRYTQQIIDKTSHIYNLVSDSDSETSGEHLTDDKDDCVIVEEKNRSDIVNIPEETSSKTRDTRACPLFIYENLKNNRLERMKRREDFELERALSQKCTVNVDFKRNIGLIGMTIKQKFVKDTSSETASSKVNKTKISRGKDKKPSYIKAVDKALNNVGTELLAVPEVAENTKKDRVSEAHPRQEANDLGENFPVKFSLGKISEKLLQHINGKKRHSKSQTIKHQDNRLDTLKDKPKSGPNLAKPLKLSSFTNKGISSSNIKNIEKTNRFKNTQAKALESMLLYLLRKPNKKQVVTDSKKVEKGTNQNPPKSTDNRREPNSPILPCTLAKKVRNTNDSVKALENIVDHVVNKPVIENIDTKSVMKPPKKGTINVISSMNSSQVTSKKDTKKLLPKLKDNGQINKSEARQESNVSISDIQICPPNHTNVTPMSENVSIGLNNLSNSNIFPSQTNITSLVTNSNVVPIDSSNCVVTSSQSVNADPKPSNKITPENVITSQCNPVTTANNNLITVFNEGQTRLRDGPVNELNCNIIKNYNNGSYNSCSSAIILRPPRSNDYLSRVRPIHPGQYGLEIQKRPYQMQPRFYHNPYRSNYTPPHMRNKRFNPRLANCLPANYRFPPPPPPPPPPPSPTSPENNSKSLHDPSQYHCNRTWYKPNMYPEGGPRFEHTEHPRKPFPSRLPISVLHRPSTTVNAKLGYVSQPMDIVPEKNRGHQDQYLQVPNSHGDRRNKQILDPRLITQDNKDITVDNIASEVSSDLITTKSKMLELLESATNELKRGIHEDDNITNDILCDTFKLPKISKLETVTEDFYSQQVDQQIGYSPPILPIPTFKNVLDHAKIDTQLQDKQIINIVPPINANNEIKNMNVPIKQNMKAKESTGKRKETPKNKSSEIKYTNDCNKRAASVKSQKYSTKEDIKKISLDEYKKRTMAHQSGDSDKINYRDNNNINKQRWAVPNTPRSNVNRFSTESDLGYDSDSTVIL